MTALLPVREGIGEGCGEGTIYNDEGTTIESVLARITGFVDSLLCVDSVAFAVFTPRVLFQGASSADSFCAAKSFDGERPLREVSVATKERGLGGAGDPPATPRCGLGAEIAPIFETLLRPV